MANELKHKAVGTVLTQAEFEATDSHAFADQATGDILYASSTTQLRRLGIGSANEVLRTNAGATAPEWASALSGLTLTNIATAVVGHTTQVVGGNTTGEVQVLGTTAADTNITLGRWSANAFGPTLYFVKSRNGAIGSSTTVNDDDTLGAITAYADDGSDFATGVASIIFAVDDASVAGSQIGGEIRLRTTTSGGSMTTAVTIANDQSVTLGGVLDMDSNAINNIAAAGNDFGATQLDLAADFTVLGADTLILDVTAGNIGLGGDPTGTGFVQIRTPATSGTPGATGVAIRQRTIGTFTDTNTAASGTASKVIVNSFAGGQIAASNANVTITNAASMYLGSAPTAGANMTLTNAYSLWVQEAARLDGAVFINGTLDMNDNAINNIAAAGNDFAAAQLDLAADFTILGADGLNIDTTAGKLNLVPAGGIGLGGSAALGPKVRVYSNSTADYDFSGSFLDGAASQTNTITGDQAANFGWYLRSYTIAGDTGTRTVTTAATVYIPDAPTVGANAAITYPHALWIDAGSARLDGAVFINDTDDGDVTTGLTINMGAADDSILAFKSSDVNHGRTAVQETDTYGSFSKAHATQGGLKIRGLAETAAGIALTLDGYFGTPNTTKTTAGRGIIEFIEYQHDGSNNLENTDADANLVAIRTYIGSSTKARFIFDAEGSGHADVEWVAYDSHDDLALMDAFQREATGRLTPMRYGDNPLYYHREYMEGIGIVGKDSWHTEQRPDGRVQARQMVNFTKLSMLHHGAILQIGDTLQTTEERLHVLEGRLLALEGGN